MCSDELHSLIVPVLIFTDRTDLAAYILANHPYSLIFIFVSLRWDVSFTASSSKPLLCGTESQVNVSEITTSLICSSAGLIVIFSSYPYKLSLNINLYLKWPQALCRMRLIVKINNFRLNGFITFLGVKWLNWYWKKEKVTSDRKLHFKISFLIREHVLLVSSYGC